MYRYVLIRIRSLGRSKNVIFLASYDTPYGGGGGGFMNTPGAGATPGGGAGGAKRQRAQTIVPVHIREILNCGDEALQVEGKEVGMVVVVGQVNSIDSQATKTIYKISDETGSIEAFLWLEVIIWLLLLLEMSAFLFLSRMDRTALLRT
jgi:hypothetical protein